MSSIYKNHYERVAAAQKIVRSMKDNNAPVEDIVKAVFESTQLTKRWTISYLEML